MSDVERVRNVQQTLRGLGLCGAIMSESDTNTSMCVLEYGHDDNAHNLGWTVEKIVEQDPMAGDSRASITTFHVKHLASGRKFVTSNETDASWLAIVLTKAAP